MSVNSHTVTFKKYPPSVDMVDQELRRWYINNNCVIFKDQRVAYCYSVTWIAHRLIWSALSHARDSIKICAYIWDKLILYLLLSQIINFLNMFSYRGYLWKCRGILYRHPFHYFLLTYLLDEIDSFVSRQMDFRHNPTRDPRIFKNKYKINWKWISEAIKKSCLIYNGNETFGYAHYVHLLLNTRTHIGTYID